MANKKVEEAPVELSIEERLTALYQLQLVASNIDRIRTIRGELPLEIEELQDEIEGKHTRNTKMQGEIGKLKSYIEQNRERIRIARQLIEKYQEQINAVRNNREYDVLSKELENQNLDVQLFEKNIAEDQVRITQLEEQIQLLDAETTELQSVMDTKQKELDVIVAETQQEEDELLKKSAELEKLVEPRVLKAFNRMRSSTHNGMAVATIDREACTGCFNKIPPQCVIDLYTRRKVIACEYCGRILVDPELAREAEEALE